MTSEEKKLCRRLCLEAKSSPQYDAWTTSERIAEEVGVTGTEVRAFLRVEKLWD